MGKGKREKGKAEKGEKRRRKEKNKREKKSRRKKGTEKRKRKQKGKGKGEREHDKREKNRNTPEVPEGGWPGAGRPKEPIKYNSHDHPRGYDPIGRVAWKNSRTTSNESVDLVKKYGLSKLVVDKQSLLSENSSLMDEENILPEEI